MQIIFMDDGQSSRIYVKRRRFFFKRANNVIAEAYLSTKHHQTKATKGGKRVIARRIAKGRFRITA
ncbi:hypothetical protein Leryth_001911 [Lithospermum erythrorhizon]|nr:hypothetical protein Leryth_001911 [Lithospermum erythrorhizon]